MANLRLNDQGSVLPLMIGMVALLMIVLGGLSSLAEVTSAQRWLHQVADEAVVAATTEIDLDRYYLDGAAGRVPLEASEARSRVASTIAGLPILIEHVSISGDQVQIRLSSPVDLAWGWRRWISVEVAAKPH